jgi:DNA-binding transcriptional ArsR family regulator
MVKYYTDELDVTFMALADATRRAIINRLSQGPFTVSELAEPFDISLPAVSKHLKILENAGLLERRRDGRVHLCSLKAEPMKEAADWIAKYQRFWDERLDALDSYFKELNQKEKDDDDDHT